MFRGDYRRAMMSFQLGLQDLDEQRRLLDSVRAELPPPPGLSAEVVGLPVAAARGLRMPICATNRAMALSEGVE